MAAVVKNALIYSAAMQHLYTFEQMMQSVVHKQTHRELKHRDVELEREEEEEEEEFEGM